MSASNHSLSPLRFAMAPFLHGNRLEGFLKDRLDEPMAYEAGHDKLELGGLQECFGDRHDNIVTRFQVVVEATGIWQHQDSEDILQPLKTWAQSVKHVKL